MPRNIYQELLNTRSPKSDGEHHMVTNGEQQSDCQLSDTEQLVVLDDLMLLKSHLGAADTRNG